MNGTEPERKYCPSSVRPYAVLALARMDKRLAMLHRYVYGRIRVTLECISTMTGNSYRQHSAVMAIKECIETRSWMGHDKLVN